MSQNKRTAVITLTDNCDIKFTLESDTTLKNVFLFLAYVEKELKAGKFDLSAVRVEREKEN